MKRLALYSMLLLYIVFVGYVYLNPALSVVTRSLLEFYENIEMGELSREDIEAERYWTMVDERGREIIVTGRKIHIGDEYLTSDNKLYRVFRVEGRIAYARFIREVGVLFEEEPTDILTVLREYFTFGIRTVQQQDEGPEIEPQQEPARVIGIYHTHNAESYVPTDGTDSIYGEGGIHAVGQSFADALETKGITVLHDETLHLPHDRGAYRRSRNTVQQLLEEGPDVVFDIHRDAAPRRAYAAEIGDEWVTQVQFVVGRQNSNMRVTRQFALDLKQTADQVHPGLVKGIFMARGNYNQDLTPLNLLLEVGAHTNSREAAEDGAALFADVVSFYFYGPENEEGQITAPSQSGQAPSRGPGGLTQAGEQAARASIFRLLGITAFIIITFLFLNAGNWEDVKHIIEPWLDRINTALGHGKIIVATVSLTRKGDRYLEMLRDRIWDARLVVIEKFHEADRWLKNLQEIIREKVK